MASARWEIMARKGPEDTLEAVQLSTNSSAQVTAGNDWTVVSKPSAGAGLFHTDEKESQRFTRMLESDGQESRVLRDLASSRQVCSQPSFALELCKRTFRQHQLKQCTPSYVELLKCQVKMYVATWSLSTGKADLTARYLRRTRAVDMLCKPQFGSLAQCLTSAGGDAAKCVTQVTAFDQCTEDF